MAVTKNATSIEMKRACCGMRNALAATAAKVSSRSWQKWLAAARHREENSGVWLRRRQIGWLWRQRRNGAVGEGAIVSN